MVFVSLIFLLLDTDAFYNDCYMWQVVDAPEILTVIGKIPYLSEFLNSLYDCQYKAFFSAFGKYFHFCDLFLFCAYLFLSADFILCPYTLSFFISEGFCSRWMLI